MRTCERFAATGEFSSALLHFAGLSTPVKFPSAQLPNHPPPHPNALSQSWVLIQESVFS